MKLIESIPAGWKFHCFGDLAKFSRELFQVEPTECYRELTLRLYGNGFEIRREVAGAALVADEMQRMKTGQLVTSIHQFRNGAVGIVPPELEGAILSKNFLVYDLDSTVVDATFLLRFLTAPSSIYFFQANSTGSATPIFPKAMIEEVEIPLPPLVEQRRVVARIEKLAAQIHEARTLRHQAAEEAEALSASWLNSAFTTLAKKFARSLGDVTEIIGGGSLPDTTLVEEASSDVLLLKVSDMNRPGNEVFIRDSAMGLPNNSPLLRGFRVLPPQSIVFPKRGGAIATNKKRILTKPAVLDPNTMGVFPKQESELCHEFLFNWFNNLDLASLQQGTSVPQINKSDFVPLQIPVPPLAEQRRIVAELDTLQAEVDALKRLQAATAAELAALLPAILDKVFKGEL
jgi:type I restriction enzyme S subunit